MADLNRKGDLEVNIVDKTNQYDAHVTDGNRLKVETSIIDDQQIIINPRPGKGFRQYLLNGSSYSMNVDGSSTPVTFQNAPASGKIWYISSISIILEDSSMNFEKFGGISSLTNGVDWYAKENNGSEELLANIKRNGDYYGFATDIIFDSASTDIMVISINLFKSEGTMFKLIGSNSDYIKAIINDNLTSIQRFNVIIRGYEVDE